MTVEPNVTSMEDIADELRTSEGKVTVRPMHYDLTDYDRVTANFQFYFEQDGEEPNQRTCTFSDGVHKSNEEPYARRLKIGETPTPLDLGWLADEEVGLIIIENHVGKNDKVRQTDEVLEQRKKQILLLKDHPEADGFKIRPGRFAFIEPVNAKGLTLQSLSGTIKAHVLVCPGGSKE